MGGNSSLIPGGCVLLARKMLDSDLMDHSPLVVKLWVWLLLKANWKDRDQLMRGQLVTTIAEMQGAMSHYAGWRKIRPTPDQIRTAYEALTLTARLTTRRTTRGMVITILNYEAFQDISAYGSRTEARKEIATCPAATPHDTEEGEERKKENKPLADYSAEFVSFWQAYPRRTAKDAAYKAWKKIKSPAETLALILKALEWQKASENWTKSNGQFIPHPATYLNAGSWKDEAPVSLEPATAELSAEDIAEKERLRKKRIKYDM